MGLNNPTASLFSCFSFEATLRFWFICFFFIVLVEKNRPLKSKIKLSIYLRKTHANMS